MNDNILRELYARISHRKQNPRERSYTCYLFSQGIDKILKKVGEESAETIIAAKNQNNVDLKNEVCDLIYHLLVMMKERDLPLEDVFEELEVRSHKIGNLKTMKKVDRNT